MKRILTILATVIMLFGFVGFMGGALVNMGFIKYSGELPLGDVQGFCVDTAGNIYVASGFYGVIQAYSAGGEFLRHWPAEANGGSFSIGLDRDQNIVVYTVRGNGVFVFDHSGKLLSEGSMKTDIMAQGSSPSTASLGGLRYDLFKGMFSTVISASPPQRTIVEQPLLLTLLKGPFPAWILFAIGLGSNILLRKDELLAKMKRHRP